MNIQNQIITPKDPKLVSKIKSVLVNIEKSSSKSIEDKIHLMLDNMFKYFTQETNIFSDSDKIDKHAAKIDEELKNTAKKLALEAHIEPEDLLHEVLFTIVSIITKSPSKEFIKNQVIEKKNKSYFKKILKKNAFNELKINLPQLKSIISKKHIDSNPSLKHMLKNEVKIPSIIEAEYHHSKKNHNSNIAKNSLGIIKK